MAATDKQIRLIEELHLRGAIIPCDDDGDPDFSAYDSIQQADAYIKKWGHLMNSSTPRNKSYKPNCRMDEWGGIPNC